MKFGFIVAQLLFDVSLVSPCIVQAQAASAFPSTSPAVASVAEGDVPAAFFFSRIMSDAHGETRFGQVRIPRERSDRPTNSVRSIRLTSDKITVSQLPAGFDLQAMVPERRLIIVLSGQLEVTTSDGETRTWGPGQGLLATDMGTGRGHRTRTVGGPVTTLLVQLPEDLNLDSWTVTAPQPTTPRQTQPR